MHHTHAKEVAKLGANINIGEDSSIHHTYALELVKIIASTGANITIEKEYHHSHIKEMVKFGGTNVTIKI